MSPMIRFSQVPATLCGSSDCGSPMLPIRSTLSAAAVSADPPASAAAGPSRQSQEPILYRAILPPSP